MEQKLKIFLTSKDVLDVQRIYSVSQLLQANKQEKENSAAHV